MIKIFTDGACRGNPGPGGWGVIFCYSDRETILYGGEVLTTNNRMELMAPIIALESLKKPSDIALTTDSQYVKKGITEWLSNWKRRAWKTATGKPVKNQDLWERLDNAAIKHQVKWYWTRGHSGNVYNEKADILANRAINELLHKA